MIKGTYWAAFINDKQLASSPHNTPTESGARVKLVYLPILYKTKRQAEAAGWITIKKVKVVLA